MPELLRLLLERFNFQPVSVTQCVEFASEQGLPVDASNMLNYLYRLDYTPTHTGLWIYDPEAKSRRLEEALSSLEAYEVCDINQCFLLEIINQDHNTVLDIQNALRERGLTLSKRSIYYNIYKYGVTKNVDGYLKLSQLTDVQRQIANQHKDRRYYSFTDALADRLNKEDTSIKHMMDTALSLGVRLDKTEAIRYLYILSYDNQKKAEIYSFDEFAKIKRVTKALKRLEVSEVCDEEQNLLIEVITNNHDSMPSLNAALQKRNCHVSIGFIYNKMNMLGVEENQDGYLEIPNLPQDLQKIAYDCKDRSYFPLEQILKNKLNQQPTKVSIIKEYANGLGVPLDDNLAIRYLYAFDYTPGSKKGEWVHDETAKERNIYDAILSLNSSSICNQDQCFLLEVINSDHKTQESIYEGMLKRGATCSLYVIQYGVYKFGLKQNQDGFWEIPNLSNHLREIAENHADRELKALEEFIIEYAHANDGNCTINDIYDVAIHEGINEYHRFLKISIRNLLFKKGFVLEGNKTLVKSTVYYQPEFCFNQIDDAYNAFQNRPEYYNNFAIALYYVAQGDISENQLVKKLTKQHGVPSRKAYQTIYMLRLEKTKKGYLRLPEGGQVTRSDIQTVTQGISPKSVADQIWQWVNEGKSVKEISSLIGVPLTENEIDKRIENKRKHSDTNSSAGPSAADSTQNFLQEVTGDVVTISEPHIIKPTPVTPEERLNRHNKEILKKARKAAKEYQEKLKNGQTEQRVFVQANIPVIPHQQIMPFQANLSAQQQNMLGNIIQLSSQASNKMTGTGYSVSTNSAPRLSALPPRGIPKAPNVVPMTSAMPRFYTQGLIQSGAPMIGGIYIANILSHMVSKDKKFAKTATEFSPFILAPAIGWFSYNSVGVKGGVWATTKAVTSMTANRLASSTLGKTFGAALIVLSPVFVFHAIKSNVRKHADRLRVHNPIDVSPTEDELLSLSVQTGSPIIPLDKNGSLTGSMCLIDHEVAKSNLQNIKVALEFISKYEELYEQYKDGTEKDRSIFNARVLNDIQRFKSDIQQMQPVVQKHLKTAQAKIELIEFPRQNNDLFESTSSTNFGAFDQWVNEKDPLSLHK